MPILDAKYKKADIEDLIKTRQDHLEEVSLQYDTLFDGVLKEYLGQPMHIDLQPDASSVYRRMYPVPQVHLATFKKDLLDHLVEIGVLSPVRDME